MDKFWFWLSGYLRIKVIHDNGKPYLERYYIGQLFGFTFYLHRFVASDPDRGLHDHPWTLACALVLSRGGYIELRRDRSRVVRWFNVLTGDTFHRVILPVGSPFIWTLFVHRSAYVKPWGFWLDLKYEHVTLGGRKFDATWREHKAVHSGRNKWWKTNPKGRHVKRDAKGVAYPLN